MQWNSNTELIIVSSHYTENLDWLKVCKYPVVVCSKIGAITPSIPVDPKCIIPNKGNEASSYLNFIIQYYDVLPQYMAFIHGHETSWHQSVDILEAINGALYKEFGYVSLNGRFVKRNLGSEFHVLISDIWNTYFEKLIGVCYPENNVLHDSCAQFIVSREKIYKYTKDQYMYMLDLIYTIELPKLTYGKFSKPPKCDSSFLWGLIFEFTWHIIFGEVQRLESYEDYMITHFTCFKDQRRQLLDDYDL